MEKTEHGRDIWWKSAFLSLCVIFSISLLPNLIKISYKGYNLRLSLWFYLPLLIFSFYKKDQIVKKLKETSAKVLLTLLAWNILLALMHLSVRSIGFSIWLLCNLLLYFIVPLFDRNILFRLLTYFQLGNSLFVIFTHIYNRVVPFSPLAGDPSFYFVDETRWIFRSFGFYQEPSYMALGLTGVIAYVVLFAEEFRYWRAIYFTLVLSLALTFSKLGYLVLIVSAAGSSIYYLKSKSKRFISSACYSLAAISIGLLIEPSFIHFGSNKLEDHLITSNKVVDSISGQGSNSDRLNSLKQAMSLAENSFYSGVGIGNSKSRMEGLFPEQKVEGVHNLYLEILLEQGVIGVMLFIIGIAMVIRKIKTNTDRLLPLFFVLLVPMMFCQNINSPTIWIFLSLIPSDDEDRRGAYGG